MGKINDKQVREEWKDYGTADRAGKRREQTQEQKGGRLLNIRHRNHQQIVKGERECYEKLLRNPIQQRLVPVIWTTNVLKVKHALLDWSLFSVQVKAKMLQQLKLCRMFKFKMRDKILW